MPLPRQALRNYYAAELDLNDFNLNRKKLIGLIANSGAPCN